MSAKKISTSDENTPVLSEANVVIEDNESLLTTNGGVLATLSALVGGGICTISYGINDTGLVFVVGLIIAMTF